MQLLNTQTAHNETIPQYQKIFGDIGSIAMHNKDAAVSLHTKSTHLNKKVISAVGFLSISILPPDYIFNRSRFEFIYLPLMRTIYMQVIQSSLYDMDAMLYMSLNIKHDTY